MSIKTSTEHANDETTFRQKQTLYGYRWSGRGPLLKKTYTLSIYRQGEWRQVMSEETTNEKERKVIDTNTNKAVPVLISDYR